MPTFPTSGTGITVFFLGRSDIMLYFGFGLGLAMLLLLISSSASSSRATRLALSPTWSSASVDIKNANASGHWPALTGLLRLSILLPMTDNPHAKCAEILWSHHILLESSPLVNSTSVSRHQGVMSPVTMLSRVAAPHQRRPSTGRALAIQGTALCS